jgi:hypothetical protein
MTPSSSGKPPAPTFFWVGAVASLFIPTFLMGARRILRRAAHFELPFRCFSSATDEYYSLVGRPRETPLYSAGTPAFYKVLATVPHPFRVV